MPRFNVIGLTKFSRRQLDSTSRNRFPAVASFSTTSVSTSQKPPPDHNYFNFPKKFVERQLRLGVNMGHHHEMLNERPPELRVYGEHRPWSDEWARDNYPEEGMLPGKGHSHHYEKAWKELPLVEPIKDPVIFVGDRVEILVGKDKGKQGLVSQVIPERNWCYIEGLNTEYDYWNEMMVTKKEKPLLVTTQVKLVDPVDERGTDVEWRFTEEGDMVRVSLRSERIIDIPSLSQSSAHYSSPESYVPGEKDTDPKIVVETTYAPSLKTVEEDILDELGIVETRKRGKTYWY